VLGDLWFLIGCFKSAAQNSSWKTVFLRAPESSRDKQKPMVNYSLRKQRIIHFQIPPLFNLP